MSTLARHTGTIPDMQPAQVFKSQRSPIEHTTIKTPTVGLDEILVKIMYSGVCHTDLHAWKGDWPMKVKEYLVGGHEGTGVVVATGSQVKDIAIGDRVGVQWVNRSCGTCEFCVTGKQPLCPGSQLSGYTVDGTFQQYCVCKGEKQYAYQRVFLSIRQLRVVTSRQILCAGVTVYKAIKDANAKPGQTIAIFGAGGGLGSVACQYAKARGCRVLALSTGASKRKMCIEELDVDYFVDYKFSPHVIDKVRALTDGGPHATVVVSAVKEPLNMAIKYVRPGGTVVAVGLPAGGIPVDIFTMVSRSVTLKGSYVGNRYDTEEAFEVLSQDGFVIPHRVVDLEELPEVYRQMEKGEMQGRTVLRIGESQQIASSLFQLSQPKFCPSHYNLGTLLAYRMEQLGGTDYFAVPGDFNLTLLDQILKNKALRMVGCCNELNAGYAADGYARSSTGRVAVVFVTFMVGGLSVINAIAGAYSEGLRVIVISGCPPQHTFGQNKLIHHTLGIKDRDQALQMFAEVTTVSTRITTKADPGQSLDYAISRCLYDSLPVYIEIPSDLAQTQVAYKTPPPYRIVEPCQEQTSYLTEAIRSITQTWKSATRPIVLVGARARHFASSDLLVAFIDKVGCPVFVQPDGKSIVPESHPQLQGTFWSSASEPTCEEAVLSSDLWVTIGCRWTDYHTLGNHLDIDRESHRILDLQKDSITSPDGTMIEGVPMQHILRTLTDSDIVRKSNSFAPLETNHTNGHVEVPDTQALSVSSILQGIQNILGPDDTLIAETGDSWFNAQSIKLPTGATFQMQMMYGSIGWSLPATLGHQLGKPGGRVITLIGDGSFQMTAQELSTMIRTRVNSIIVIFNNLGYAIETAIHDGPYNYSSNWNYASLAKSLCSTFHASYPNNKHAHGAFESSMEPSLLSIQIKTQAELLIAVDRIQREPHKLAVLDCCISPDGISPALRRFGSAIGSASGK